MGSIHNDLHCWASKARAQGRDTIEIDIVTAERAAQQIVDLSNRVMDLEHERRTALRPAAPVVGREEIDRAVHDWILDDVPLGLKLQMNRALSNKLTDRILSALHAARFAENAKQAIDPRLTEWGYSTTDEAITHLGKLLEDQAAFDGLASPDKMEKGHD